MHNCYIIKKSDFIQDANACLVFTSLRKLQITRIKLDLSSAGRLSTFEYSVMML